jgi:hypothetical protein
MQTNTMTSGTKQKTHKYTYTAAAILFSTKGLKAKEKRESIFMQ